eukprot:17321-Heterococcus_DN1.PRE.1
MLARLHACALSFALCIAASRAFTPFTAPGRLQAITKTTRSRLHARQRAAAGPTMVAAERTRQIGSADLDWPNLGFAWRDVNSHVKFVYKDGAWGPGELVKDSYVQVHIASTGLHYGQSVFEGMKAFHCKDGKVRIFRPYENAARIKASAERILMAVPPPELFVEGVKQAIRDNVEFVPPYGSDGALYIRPLLFGSGARIGLQPSDEYTLLIMVMPVGNYYKGGMHPTTAVVIDNYDRAAPRGVGAVKVAGNYAADMLPNVEAKKAGYPIGLYLDAKTNTYVEEFSTSNFLAITKDNNAIITSAVTGLCWRLSDVVLCQRPFTFTISVAG